MSDNDDFNDGLDDLDDDLNAPEASDLDDDFDGLSSLDDDSLSEFDDDSENFDDTETNLDEEEFEEEFEEESEEFEQEATPSPVLKLAAIGALGLAVIGFGGYNVLLNNGIIGSTTSAPASAAPSYEDFLTAPAGQSQNTLPGPSIDAAAAANEAQSTLDEITKSALNGTPSPEASVSLPANSDKPSVSMDDDDTVSANKETSSQAQLFDADALRTLISDELNKRFSTHEAWISDQFTTYQGKPVSSSAETASIIKGLKDLGIEIRDNHTSLKKEVVKISSGTSDMARNQQKPVDKSSISGRERIPGFQITGYTTDGATSVVRSPSGRIMAFYKGESFYVGSKQHTISDVKSGGRILLVDGSYFIDEIYVKPMKKAKKTISKEKETKKEKAISVEEKTESNESAAEPAKQEISKPEPLLETRTFSGSPLPSQGWSFHGIFDEGYLLNTPKNEWIILTNGQFVEGLGRVSGIDSQRQLVIGPYIIPLSR